LLPARNCAADLPGYFASARQFADVVVALDDGSTDETPAMLEAEPLVHTVLRNPRRDSYAGWDDAANRSRLLEAASLLEPDWIVSMDADERLDAADAHALLDFLDTQAVRGEGYSMRCYPMADDGSGYIPSRPVWMARLFAWAPGQVFPSERLHFVPLPTSIPPDLWRRTSLRLQHLGGADDARRRDRFAKYLQADPDRRYQRSYLNLLVPRPHAWPWWDRSEHLPVLCNGPDPHPLPSGQGGVDLSIVVTAASNPSALERVVRGAIAAAADAPARSVEVIVAARAHDEQRGLRHSFPSVQIVDIDPDTSASNTLAACLAAASGAHILFVSPDEELVPGSVSACLAAHDLGYALVGPTVRCKAARRSGWADYFLTYADDLPGPAGPLTKPPRSCSYLRQALEELGPLPEEVAADPTAINRALFDRGYGAYRAAEMIVATPEQVSARRMLARQFRRGRREGRAVMDQSRWEVARPLKTMGRHVRHGLRHRLRSVSSAVWHDPGLHLQMRRAKFFIVGGAVAWWAGGWCEMIRQVPAGLGHNRALRQTAARLTAGVQRSADAGDNVSQQPAGVAPG
jgi:hypothetical protein